MSLKHTPGPWALGAESSDETGQVIAADGSHIAYVECDPVAANARLIAAAPDLLSALQALDFAQDQGCTEETWATLWAEARAAIAAATRE